MKRIKIVFTLFSLFAFTVSAQNHSISVPKASESQSNSANFPIDAHALIELANKINGVDYTEIAKEMRSLQKSVAWNFNLGDKKS
ncbi:MAG: hypothetical protein Q8T08_06695, partial [Ignavibacteria bacterium]|nr:hypothetical protein [Ignavibacteria bacterium]